MDAVLLAFYTRHVGSYVPMGVSCAPCAVPHACVLLNNGNTIMLKADLLKVGKYSLDDKYKEHCLEENCN